MNVPSPRGENDRHDIDNRAARAAVPENKAVDSVDANNGFVTYSYQVACKGRFMVTSTKETGPDKR